MARSEPGLKTGVLNRQVQWGAIHWIWQKVHGLRIADCTFKYIVTQHFAVLHYNNDYKWDLYITGFFLVSQAMNFASDNIVNLCLKSWIEGVLLEQACIFCVPVTGMEHEKKSPHIKMRLNRYLRHFPFVYLQRWDFRISLQNGITDNAGVVHIKWGGKTWHTYGAHKT